MQLISILRHRILTCWTLQEWYAFSACVAMVCSSKNAFQYIAAHAAQVLRSHQALELSGTGMAALLARLGMVCLFALVGLLVLTQSTDDASLLKVVYRWISPLRQAERLRLLDLNPANKLAILDAIAKYG